MTRTAGGRKDRKILKIVLLVLLVIGLVFLFNFIRIRNTINPEYPAKAVSIIINFNVSDEEIFGDISKEEKRQAELALNRYIKDRIEANKNFDITEKVLKENGINNINPKSLDKMTIQITYDNTKAVVKKQEGKEKFMRLN